jgi:hypothetical protein
VLLIFITSIVLGLEPHGDSWPHFCFRLSAQNTQEGDRKPFLVGGLLTVLCLSTVRTFKLENRSMDSDKI